MAKNKEAKLKTGAEGQEGAIQEDIKATVVERPKRELGFVDYSKSRNTVFEGKFKLQGILVGKDKKRHWILVAIDADGKPGRWIAYFGDRKDGKGVYSRSEILSICSEFKPAENKEVITV